MTRRGFMAALTAGLAAVGIPLGRKAAAAVKQPTIRLVAITFS